MIVFLHSYAGGGDEWDLFFHTLTISAVPMFMGVSGYLLFFMKHKNDRFWIRMMIRYSALFSFWYILYVLFTYYIISVGQEVSVYTYMLQNLDGWMYWYLLVLIEILIAYPIIKEFLSNEKIKMYYILLWLVMVSLRQAITIGTIPVQILDVIQVPLFQTKSYIGGTVLAHYPTECLGVFVVLGAFIDRIIKGRVSRRVSTGIIVAGVLAGFYITIIEYLLYSMNRPTDMVTQPIQLQVCAFAAMIILLVKFWYNIIGERCKKLFGWISRQSLGVYMIHPFIIVYVRKFCSGCRISVPIIITICTGGITIAFSLVCTCMLRRILPKWLSYYVI